MLSAWTADIVWQMSPIDVAHSSEIQGVLVELQEGSLFQCSGVHHVAVAFSFANHVAVAQAEAHVVEVVLYVALHEHAFLQHAHPDVALIVTLLF